MLDRPGFFVEPTLVEATPHMPITCEETFAPILYLFEFDTLDEAIAIHNDVPQGLSLGDLHARHALGRALPLRRRLATAASPTSTSAPRGAEIGGAFGGEKETGGGREAGSDSWKAYMRRQTCTINWGATLPLAQGVKFDV